MSFLRQNPLRASSSFAILAVAAVLGSCRGGQNDDAVNAGNAADDPVMNVPAVPLPEPALDRAELLRAIASAASASALGTEDSAEQRRLDGRQFEIRIRFGCRGQSPDLREAWLGWSQDQEKKTLRVRAKPTISMEDPLVAAIGGEQVEAVEGFWIPRPWLMQAECPAGAATTPLARPEEQAETTAGAEQDAAPAAQNAETDPLPVTPRLGIAQFFTSADPRTSRRDNRAYEAVKTIEEGQPVSTRGFNLVLAGRLRALPGRRVINCTAKGFDQPPECIASARFDRVWIEQPETEEAIAEWRAQ